MELKNEKLGITVNLKNDFTQSEFEKYQNSLIEATEKAKANSVVERALLQAALDAGILSGVNGQLIDLKPRAIRWLTVKVRDFINSETEVPQD